MLDFDFVVRQSRISPRSYSWQSSSEIWRAIWEAGPYYDRLSRKLEHAREHVIFAGWQIDSRLRLRRPGGGTETLKEKLLRLCESKPGLRIYLLFWDHAYFYMAEREWWQGRIWDKIHPRIHFIFDNRHPFGASHHEKICLIDGETGFCGGIDLCDERWDMPSHRYRDRRRSLNWKEESHGPYHDLSVEVRGPICAELHRHLEARWRKICALPFPSPKNLPSSSRHPHRIWMSRTQTEASAGSWPGGIRRDVEFLFRDLILGARRKLVLEGQYYWSREIQDALRARIAESALGRKLHLTLHIAELDKAKSPTRRMAPFEAHLLRELEVAGALSGARVRVCTPRVLRSGNSPRPVYVHSKILVADDRFASVGSANFATRALRLDTEAQLTREARTARERSQIRAFSRALTSHWKHSEAKSVSYLPKLRPAVRMGRPGFPWKPLYDPAVSWFFPIRRSLRSAPTRRALTGILYLSSALLTAGVGSRVGGIALLDPRLLLPSAALCLAWRIEIPFFLLALACSALEGINAASAMVLCALLLNGTWGYVLGRLSRRLGTRLALRRGRLEPPGVRARIASRDFESILSATLDPRISLRRKSALQGFYCIPVPWFLFAYGIMLSAIEISALRAIDALLKILFRTIV